MNVLRGIPTALSIYTRIPVRMKLWKEGDLGRGFLFFPLAGIPVGAASLGLWCLCEYFDLPCLFTVGTLFLVPFLLVGGLHYDGFMDTEDALGSMADRDRKLEILKDSHIGAFAMIAMIRHTVFYLSFLYLWVRTTEIREMLFYSLLFVLSRAVCGISSVVLRKARKEGMLYEETERNGRGLLVSFLIWTAVTLILMGILNPGRTLAVAGIHALFLLYYRWIIYRNFGGATGDTAGYYVVMSEGLSLVSFFV